MKHSRMRKTSLIAACIWAAAIIFYVVYHSTKDYRPAEGELTRVEIFEIASSYLESHIKESGYLSVEYRDIRNYRFSVDRNNRVWNENFAAEFLNLRGRNYQAVRFTQKTRKPLRLPLSRRISGGWGSYWICLDRRTGEVLASTMSGDV